MADSLMQSELSEIREEVLQTKRLLEMVNRIHAVKNINQILIDLKEGILNLFVAHSIYVWP